MILFARKNTLRVLGAIHGVTKRTQLGAASPTFVRR